MKLAVIVRLALLAALGTCWLFSHSSLAATEPALPLIAAASHPFQRQIDRVLESQAAIQPTGLARADYLKYVAGQVRALRKYQKPDGDFADPVDGRNQYAPPCFAHCVATLAASGYDADPQLLQSGMSAMDFCVSSLLKGKSAFRDGHPDFYIHPVMLAFELFANVAPKERLETWRKQLAAIDPAKTYTRYGVNENNWTLVHTGGEFLRSLHGMTDLTYVQRVLEGQQGHMTKPGLYLENGAPFAYDAFSRYFLAGMLNRGLRDAFYRDACWKGAWTSLLIQSPTGEMPTSFRSSQHVWNEAELAAICELYATAYGRAGRPAEAGAFKRGAHLAMQSLRQWIRPDGSGYIVKNRFPLEARHGYESYSVYINYNLLACSMLCSAWQHSDDSIQEKPAPADVGGFVIQIPEFNMVVANAGGSYVQFKTCGDGHYNPTGLLRVHLRGAHPQLGYSDGLLDNLKPVSAGPVEILEESLSQVRFRAGETITVNADGVTVETRAPIRFPMLVNDGQEETRVSLDGNALRLRLGGLGVDVTVTEPASATWKRTATLLNHHNGKVEVALAEGTVYRITAPKTPGLTATAAAEPEAIPIIARRVNQWQLAHPIMKANDRNWERGTWYTGVMAMYKATGDETFLKAAMDFGILHQWQVGTENGGANKMFCAETWVELYFLKHDRTMIEPLITWVNGGGPNSPSSGKIWYLEGGRRYADSLYGACTLAMLTKATGEQKYLDYMHAFFWDVQAELFDPAFGLFYRDKRYLAQTNQSGNKIFWSRGNGWVIAGLARILEYLPENDPQRPRYVTLFKTMAAAIARHQGDDGLWRVNLADSAQFDMPETSGSGFFCYAIAWGLNRGILERAAYEPVVRKAWNGLVSSVSPEGKVQWGQLVAADPYAVKKENTHEYVTGTFLLAASEMFKLQYTAR